jgi:hypothetical protein
VRKLLKIGANVNAKDKDGKTPVYIASQKDHRDIVELVERAALHPLELLRLEQDGIEAGKWGRLRIMLKAYGAVTVGVELSGDEEWLDQIRVESRENPSSRFQ